MSFVRCTKFGAFKYTTLRILSSVVSIVIFGFDSSMHVSSFFYYIFGIIIFLPTITLILNALFNI